MFLEAVAMTEPTERDRRRDFSSNRRRQFRHRL